MRNTVDAGPGERSGLFQAADRALQMLECFEAERAALSVTELAERLHIHVSTACRLAATLEARKFLERAPGTRSFRLGPKMGKLGFLAFHTRDLVTVARPVMDRLASETGETAGLGVLDGTEAVNLLQVDGPHLIGLGNWAGRRTPLHCVANGKLLLALATSPIDLGPGPLKRYTPQTITSLKALRIELEKIRRQGWAANVEEIEEGHIGVATPIFDVSGRCRAALSIAGPSFRVPAARLPQLAKTCLAASREISEGLGHFKF